MHEADPNRTRMNDLFLVYYPMEMSGMCLSLHQVKASRPCQRRGKGNIRVNSFITLVAFTWSDIFWNISKVRQYFDKYLTESCCFYLIEQSLFKYLSNISQIGELWSKLSDHVCITEAYWLRARSNVVTCHACQRGPLSLLTQLHTNVLCESPIRLKWTSSF